jgi:GNAT superfamily N-acetyltransferase
MCAGTTIIISQVQTDEQLDAVRRFMRAFVAWHRERHHDYRDLINKYFDPTKFEEELSSLPGDFSPPLGRLLIASEGGNEVGCVALRDLDDGVCEMKRLFVDPSFQGRGAGMALGEAVIAEAKAIGYRTMRLDTGPGQKEAQGLYRRLGFKPIEAYYELDDDMRNWLVFMELDLTGR